jgi:ATP-dependent DNA helicase DinG
VTVPWRAATRFLPRAAQDELAARVPGRRAARNAGGRSRHRRGQDLCLPGAAAAVGRRALVSTATKSLQDQLFLRDLPRLREQLGVPVRMALAQGPRQLPVPPPPAAGAGPAAQLPDRFCRARAGTASSQWAQATRSGDLAEMDGLDERSPVIPLVTSTRDNCLGTDCPEYRACHVVQARREAMAADLVVVNHHLFFADMALRDSGVAELLPTVDAAVFDEAHQLVEAGVQFLGPRWPRRRPSTWRATCWPWATAACPRPAALAANCRRHREAPRASCAWPAPAPARRARPAQAALGRTRPSPRCRPWPKPACRRTGRWPRWPRSAPDFPKLEQRARELAALAHRFQPSRAGHVRWVDLSAAAGAAGGVAAGHPRDADRTARAAPKAWIFTSATLGDDDALTWFTADGAGRRRQAACGSPFDYAAHARVWVPARMPLPNAPGHPAAVGALAARCAHALGGRTFVLTTTLRVLPIVAEAHRRPRPTCGPA